jgi:nitrogen fixation protein NifX
MIATPISDEIALRIGLAARELPETDAARLLRVLDDVIGLPPTLDTLSNLTVKNMKRAGDGEFADVDTVAIKSALAHLKGEMDLQNDPLPEVQPYNEEDMPGSIRVACASNKGELLDGHFGSCRRFLVYQVSKDESRLIEIRPIDSTREVDDKNSYRASLIDDCQILFVASIGGPAAAKVIKAGAHPIKKQRAVPASEEIASLQQAIGEDASPWLAKAMGHSAEQRVRFEREEAE